MSSEAGPSKRRRLLSTTELEDTAPEGSQLEDLAPDGSQLEDTAPEESTRQCSKCSYNLPISHFTSVQRPSKLTKACQRCHERRIY
ncbi:hypothetical protein E4U30_006289 [Claviceps sp. LM220 group G6]|nr:hypothetical protein E4U30_006289 [Claviceps sp. LM220 group G6]